MKIKPILIVAGILSPLLVYAAGIQVAPSELNFVLKEADLVEKQLVVANPTSNVQVLEIYPDEYEKLIVPHPASLTLEAGERKMVKITVEASKADLKMGQSLATNLSVIARPLSDNGLTVNAGVKIPVRITLKQTPLNNYNLNLLWAAALLAIIVIGYLVKRGNKKPAS